ncbi:hypothetical protein J6590_046687 [Homalodisca vitripennis]|nr:hypothetical protein J6590_046687 [Homalodisca vitripennis]
MSYGDRQRAQKNDKDWTVQKRLLSARRASQIAVFDNEIERWGEVDVPGSAARDPHGIKQITVGPPHGIKQITMFIRENVECLDSSFTTTTTIKVNNFGMTAVTNTSQPCHLQSDHAKSLINISLSTVADYAVIQAHNI